MSVTLDLQPGHEGVSIETFALLTKVLSAASPSAEISNHGSAYRITLSDDFTTEGLPERLRDLAEQIEADDDYDYDDEDED